MIVVFEHGGGEFVVVRVVAFHEEHAPGIVNELGGVCGILPTEREDLACGDITILGNVGEDAFEGFGRCRREVDRLQQMNAFFPIFEILRIAPKLCEEGSKLQHEQASGFVLATRLIGEVHGIGRRDGVE